MIGAAIVLGTVFSPDSPVEVLRGFNRLLWIPFLTGWLRGSWLYFGTDTRIPLFCCQSF